LSWAGDYSGSARIAKLAFGNGRFSGEPVKQIVYVVGPVVRFTIVESDKVSI